MVLTRDNLHHYTLTWRLGIYTFSLEPPILAILYQKYTKTKLFVYKKKTFAFIACSTFPQQDPIFKGSKPEP